MTVATRITSKGQVVIPKAVRDRLRWRPGTRLAVEEGPTGAVTLRLADVAVAGAGESDPIERAFGFLTEGDPLGDLEAEHRAEVANDEHSRRH